MADRLPSDGDYGDLGQNQTRLFPTFETTSKFAYVPDDGVIVEGESMFEPDMSLSITEIFERAQSMLTDYPPELPDDVPDYYDDLTDALEPITDDWPEDDEQIAEEAK